jgi:hypothetical protein
MGLACGLNFRTPAPFVLGKVIPSLNHLSTFSAFLAARLYRLRLAFVSTNDVEME